LLWARFISYRKWDNRQPRKTKQSRMDIQQKTILTFDCYGTLIDWESGIWDGFQKLLCANNSTMQRNDCLAAFAEIESRIQAEFPDKRYCDVLRLTHHQFADRFGLLTDDEMDRRFGGYVPFWPAFADSADSLRQLKSRFDLVILSNVDRTSFAGSQDRLGVMFDAIFTAEDIGSYKPDTKNFDYMLDQLKQDKSAILHVAQSLFHDIRPATQAGLDTVWIDRQGLAEGGSWGATAKLQSRPQPGLRFSTLQQFADYIYPDQPADQA